MDNFLQWELQGLNTDIFPKIQFGVLISLINSTGTADFNLYSHSISRYSHTAASPLQRQNDRELYSAGIIDCFCLTKSSAESPSSTGDKYCARSRIREKLV